MTLQKRGAVFFYFFYYRVFNLLHCGGIYSFMILAGQSVGDSYFSFGRINICN